MNYTISTAQEQRFVTVWLRSTCFNPVYECSSFFVMPQDLFPERNNNQHLATKTFKDNNTFRRGRDRTLQKLHIASTRTGQYFTCQSTVSWSVHVAVGRLYGTKSAKTIHIMWSFIFYLQLSHVRPVLCFESSCKPRLKLSVYIISSFVCYWSDRSKPSTLGSTWSPSWWHFSRRRKPAYEAL